MNIKLDEPATAFKPGDRLSGRCICTEPNPKDWPEAIDIKLISTAVSTFIWEASGKDIAKGNVPLLSKTLLVSEYDDSTSGRRVWQFEGVMPRNIQSHEILVDTTPLRNNWTSFEEDDIFTPSSMQAHLPLPPTFIHERNKDTGRKTTARVIYKIQMTPLRPGPSGRPMLPSERELPFCPLSRPTNNSHNSQVMRDDERDVQDSRLLPKGYSERSRSPRRGLSKVFKGSTTAKFCFSVNTYCVKETDLKGPLAFSCAVVPTNASSMLPVLVESLSIQLISLLWLRFIHPYGRIETSFIEDPVFEQTTYLRKELKEVDMHRLTHHLALPSDDLTSTFHTANIVHGYKISFTWKLRCVDVTSSIEGSMPLVIKPFGGAQAEPINPPQVYRRGSEGPPPPTYGEALK